MLTRIRNANVAKHQTVQIPVAKMSVDIASILKDEGFIEDFEKCQEDKRECLLLSSKRSGKARKPVVSTLERISKPGLCVCTKSKELPKC